jgi:metallophosphoesterase superfamily enzyme
MTHDDDKLNRILHDAEHAQSGYEFAHMMGHKNPAAELRDKRDRLVREAIAIEPTCSKGSWREVRPEIRNLAKGMK